MGEFTQEDNKAVIYRYFEEVYNQAREEVIDEIVAPSYIDYGHNPPGRGTEGAKQDLRGLLTAFSDLQFTIDDLIAEGNKVVARWTGNVTHSGEFVGVPATGKRVTMTGISIYRLEDKQLIETRNAGDLLGLLQQLGAIPSKQ
ncbi:ester cyclase [Chroococcidiopsis sp.]|uniref:ester cyclase n=1 Tax=Chroococcidiopsis sp. TaxID=3088168 RepID=UPI003F2FB71B